MFYGKKKHMSSRGRFFSGVENGGGLVRFSGAKRRGAGHFFLEQKICSGIFICS